MTKVLMLTGDAAESLEVMYPYQRLPIALAASGVLGGRRTAA